MTWTSYTLTPRCVCAQVLKGLSFESVEIGECFLLNFIIAGCFHGLAYMMLASRQTKFLQFAPVKP